MRSLLPDTSRPRQSKATVPASMADFMPKCETQIARCSRDAARTPPWHDRAAPARIRMTRAPCKKAAATQEIGLSRQALGPVAGHHIRADRGFGRDRAAS